MSKRVTVDISNKIAVACAFAALLVVGRFTCGDELQAETGSPVQRRAGTGTSAGAFVDMLAPGGSPYKVLGVNPSDTSVAKWVDQTTGVGLSTATPASVVAGPGTAGTGTSAVKEGHAHQLGSNTPTPGMLPFAGTGTAAGTDTTASITWRYGQASDIAGLPTVSGTPNYVAKFGTGGVVDSHIYEDATYLYQTLPINLGSSYDTVKLLTYDDGYQWSGLGAYGGDTLRLFGSDYAKRITFGSQTHAGVFTKGMELLDKTLTIEGGLAVKTLPGGGVGKYLYQSSTDGTISAKTIAATDVGAEPTLSACAPGQAVVYTGTGTGTSTAKGCGTITGVAYSFSTSTPAAVATSGAVGTSTQLSHSDHKHAYTDDHLTEVTSGGGTGTLWDLIFSSLGSISVGLNTSQSPTRLSLNAVYGTSTPAGITTSGSVGTANESSRSDHVHALTGRTLVNTEEFTSSQDYWTGSSYGQWVIGPSVTFTSGGTRFNVYAQATLTTQTGDEEGPYNVCALAISADLGTSATTQRSKETYAAQVGHTNGYANITIFPNVVMYNTMINEGRFTLSNTGQTTVSLYMYPALAGKCRVPSGHLKIYIDVYK